MQINLSANDDQYTQLAQNKDQWDDIFGLAGNDVIRLYNGQVIGGPGNDRIEKVADAEPWRGLTAAYWDSPGPVSADLEAGYADDGWGTRDTLVGVTSLSGSWNNDNFKGNAQDNEFYMGGGQGVVDGRTGYDTVWLPELVQGNTNFSDFVIQVAIDGKSAVITSPLRAEFSLHISNVEALGVAGHWDEKVALTNFIEPSDLAREGLIAGDAWRWNAGKAMGTPVSLSYSFITSAPASGPGAAGFRGFSPAEQASVTALLEAVSRLTGLSFRPVSETAGSAGDLRFGVSEQAATKGVTGLPGNGSGAGVVWMDVDSMRSLAPGSEGYAALLHEIGHALGLRHPENVDPGDHYALQFNSAFDMTALTVMSATAAADGLFPATWGALDVAALRMLYGKSSVNTGDTRYLLDGLQFTADTSLIDDDGNDTIDAARAATGTSIDLRPGHVSSVGVTAGGLGAVNNLALGADTVIENAVGSAYDDVLVGNDGANVLTGGKGNDWIDGGKGLDTAVFEGARSDYLLSSAFGKVFVAARDGTSGFDTVQNVETLKFADQSLPMGRSALGADVTLSVDQGAQVAGALPDPSDESRAQVRYAVVAQPKFGTLALGSDGSYTYAPSRGFSGADSFAYSLSDAQGGHNNYLAFIDVRAFPAGLTGGDGNDTLKGTSGDDQVDGGAGTDTFVVAGKRADFRIVKTATAVILADQTGQQGVDSLSNVERLQFTDGNVALDISGIGGMVYRIYQAAFNRTPDAAGLGYWIAQMDRGVTLRQVAQGFVDSAEFKAMYGNNPSNADVVAKYYENVLHRVGEPAGVAYWRGILDQHLDSISGVLSSFSEGAENQTAVATIIGNGFSYLPF